MRKARKLITFILTAVMVLSMSMNVWAAKITINDGNVTDATYSAYKLLNATDLGDGKFSYTVKDEYRQILIDSIKKQKGEIGEISDEQIIEYIEKFSTEEIQTFANSVYAAIKEAKKDADKTSVDNVLDEVEQGYYLIAETTLGKWESEQDYDTYSLVMLDTAGNTEITVNTKEAHPTLSKEITNDNNEVAGDIADGVKNNLSVGSKVEFTLSTTIPTEAKQYDYYYCIFSDLLSEGLTFDEASLVVKSNGVELNSTDDYKLYTNPNADGNTFQVALLNAKNLAGGDRYSYL